jgi:hypothetical protein
MMEMYKEIGLAVHLEPFNAANEQGLHRLYGVIAGSVKNHLHSQKRQIKITNTAIIIWTCYAKI